MARPTSLTPEVAEELCGYLREGLPIDLACDLAGIVKQTYYNWKERGEAGEEPFAEFLDRASRVQSQAALESVQRVRAGGEIWRGNAWFLERRFPTHFRERKTQEISGPDGGPVAVQVGPAVGLELYLQGYAVAKKAEMNAAQPVEEPKPTE